MKKVPHPRPRHRGRRARLSMPALFLVSSAMAAQPAPEQTGGAGQSAEPRCVQGCERWGKACNVDPRGVYKCRRVCEKFGEICE
jgi:hypothetical protein